MGAEQRAAAARGAVLRLLTDAYQRRDRVAVVSFSGSGAQLVLRPTGSIEVARSRLATVPTGGRTPLAEAILAALDVCLGPSTRGYSPVLVVVSDGRATAAPEGLDPVEAALSAADRVASAGVPALVVDVESVPRRCGWARHWPSEWVLGTSVSTPSPTRASTRRCARFSSTCSHVPRPGPPGVQ